MRLRYVLIAVGILTTAALLFYLTKSTAQSVVITTQVEQGPFQIYVNATGELKAKRSVKIRGPMGMRSIGIWQTNITELVPEGTNVSKGDFVASLDRTELANRMSDVQTEIEKIETQLQQNLIDTTIEMKEIRDQIANLEFSMQQERLEIEKNRFEPQMIIEESRLKLEKSTRDYAQLQDKLRLKKIQSDARIGEIDANLRQQTNKLQQYITVGQEFTVMAPEDGMVIYEQSWNGKKGPGSQISGWDPVVAELPDLSDFISVIYVNEIDISKISRGQNVKIKVDAFPEKAFTGFIQSIANIGQQLRNQDARVFEVVVQLNEVDSVLRPAMTTSNEVLVYDYGSAIYVPLEAYHKNDSASFVFVKQGNGFQRREVVSHVANDNHIMIAAGLEPGESICLSLPPNADQLALVHLDQDIKDKAARDLGLLVQQRLASEKAKAANVVAEQPRQEGSHSEVMIVF